MALACFRGALCKFTPYAAPECAVRGGLCVIEAWWAAHVKAGRAAWHGNTLWRGKRMPWLAVRTRATRFSADLATCIASPCLGLTVVVVVVGLGKCVCEGFIVLFTKCALSLAVEMQEVAQILRESPDAGDCELDSEVRGVGVRDWNLQNRFPAAVELAQ